jgi:hypothetical protein
MIAGEVISTNSLLEEDKFIQNQSISKLAGLDLTGMLYHGQQRKMLEQSNPKAGRLCGNRRSVIETLQRSQGLNHRHTKRNDSTETLIEIRFHSARRSQRSQFPQRFCAPRMSGNLTENRILA